MQTKWTKNLLRVTLALWLMLAGLGKAKAQSVINSQNWDGTAYAAGAYPTGWVSSNTSYWIVTGGVGAPIQLPMLCVFMTPAAASRISTASVTIQPIPTREMWASQPTIAMKN